MNQRIRKLIEEAEVKFEAHLHHPFIDTAVIVPSDLEKFAELIQQDCLQHLTNTGQDYAREILERYFDGR